jgi:Skp family chaperone for outer membrane proteins
MKTLVERINEKIDHFQENATSHVDKLNKAAGARARKASLDLEKMLKEFRKKSLDFQNKISNQVNPGN